MYAQYTDNVINAGSPIYDTAYFVINYVRVWTVDGLPASVSNSLHHSSTTPASGSTPTSTGSNSGSNTGVVLSGSSPLYLFSLLCVGAFVVFI